MPNKMPRWDNKVDFGLTHSSHQDTRNIYSHQHLAEVKGGGGGRCAVIKVICCTIRLRNIMKITLECNLPSINKQLAEYT